MWVVGVLEGAECAPAVVLRVTLDVLYSWMPFSHRSHPVLQLTPPHFPPFSLDVGAQKCAPRVPGTSVLLLARVLRKHHSTRSGTFFPKLASHPDSYSVEQLSGHMSQFGVLKAFLVR